MLLDGTGLPVVYECVRKGENNMIHTRRLSYLLDFLSIIICNGKRHTHNLTCRKKSIYTMPLSAGLQNSGPTSSAFPYPFPLVS